jgi:hypothetical protein
MPPQLNPADGAFDIDTRRRAKNVKEIGFSAICREREQMP